MNQFKFNLGDQVVIEASGEAGTVIGRAEYSTTPMKCFFIRYRNAHGVAVEAWWTEDALVATA